MQRAKSFFYMIPLGEINQGSEGLVQSTGIRGFLEKPVIKFNVSGVGIYRINQIV